MSAYRIRRELLGEVLGLSDEGPGSDESAVSSINVRLDEMFREAIRNRSRLVLVHGDDLQKMVQYHPAWKEGGKTLTTPAWTFKHTEGLSEQLVRDINLGPATLALAISDTGKLAFCQAPAFKFERNRNIYEITIWTHVVYAPDIKD